MGSEKREGIWTVPPFILIKQGMGSVKLNCMEATPAAQLIEIEVIGGASSIVLVLPDGWGLTRTDSTRLEVGEGSAGPRPRKAAARDLWLARLGQLQGAAAESLRQAP